MTLLQKARLFPRAIRLWNSQFPTVVAVSPIKRYTSGLHVRLRFSTSRTHSYSSISQSYQQQQQCCEDYSGEELLHCIAIPKPAPIKMSLGQLKLTKPAPEWSGTAVVNGEFKDISLADYRGKYLVFFFYPADFTFICPTEIIAYSDRVEEFRAINCEVVGVSTDSHFSHLAWINTPRKQGGLGSMNIPLLADKTYDISRAYGVFKEDEGMAFRGLFVIDDKGNLRQITINDLPVGRSVDETLRLVQAFQFTDKHGEVCPANWKPGSDTIKPDVKGSKTYFSKHN